MSNKYPGGESGPRRTTPISPMADESMDTVAANAEAARLARELGVVGSSTQPTSRSLFSRFRTTANNHSSSSSSNNNNYTLEKQTEQASYFRMNDDSQRSQLSTAVTAEVDSSPSYPVQYPHVTIANSQGEPIHEFDCHGQRTPYREGPYFLSRDAAGRLVKKRWCKYKSRLRARALILNRRSISLISLHSHL